MAVPQKEHGAATAALRETVGRIEERTALLPMLAQALLKRAA